MEQTVVVTASIGERRGLVGPIIDRRADGVRYVAFVDRPVAHPLWETIRVDRWNADPCRDAKIYKVLLADFVPDATRSIWIDRHCRLLLDPIAIWERFDQSVGLLQHYRNCVYAEARRCRETHKDDPAAIRRTVDRWRREGVPEKGGLYWGGFILRRHPEADDFSRLWWDYIETGTRRDQITMPVALDRSGVSFHVFPRNYRGHLFRIRGK